MSKSCGSCKNYMGNGKCKYGYMSGEYSSENSCWEEKRPVINTTKKKQQTNWHTGTPTEEDWYLIQLVDHKKGGIPYDIVRWTGKWGIYFPIPNEEVVAWQKIEPYKED